MAGILYDCFKPRQPTPPSLDTPCISSVCSELVAVRIVEKIEEELGHDSALGGGGAKLRGSLWIVSEEAEEGDSTLGWGVGRAVGEIFELGVRFSCHVTVVYPRSMGGSNMAVKGNWSQSVHVGG